MWKAAQSLPIVPLVYESKWNVQQWLFSTIFSPIKKYDKILAWLSRRSNFQISWNSNIFGNSWFVRVTSTAEDCFINSVMLSVKAPHFSAKVSFFKHICHKYQSAMELRLFSLVVALIYTRNPALGFDPHALNQPGFSDPNGKAFRIFLIGVSKPLLKVSLWKLFLCCYCYSISNRQYYIAYVWAELSETSKMIILRREVWYNKNLSMKFL